MKYHCHPNHNNVSHTKNIACPIPATISIPFPAPPPPPPTPTPFLARTASIGAAFETVTTTDIALDIPLTVASAGNGIGFDPITGRLIILETGFYNLYYEYNALTRGDNIIGLSTELTANGVTIPGSQATATFTSPLGVSQFIEVPFAQRPPAPTLLVAGTAIGLRALVDHSLATVPETLFTRSAVLTIESSF